MKNIDCQIKFKFIHHPHSFYSAATTPIRLPMPVSGLFFSLNPSLNAAMQTLSSAEFFDTPAPRLAGMQVKTLQVAPQMSVSLMQSQEHQQFLALADEQDAQIHFSCQLAGSTAISQPSRQFELNASNALISSFCSGGFYLDCSAAWRSIELRIGAQSLMELAAEDDIRALLNCSNPLWINPNTAPIREAASKLAQWLAASAPCALLLHAAALEFIACT